MTPLAGSCDCKRNAKFSPGRATLEPALSEAGGAQPWNYFAGSTESRPTTNFLRGGKSWHLVKSMGGFDREPGRAWDEYDWERFLQQQDHKTEKYMELLEK